jgi:hypothetical protein
MVKARVKGIIKGRIDERIKAIEGALKTYFNSWKKNSGLLELQDQNQNFATINLMKLQQILKQNKRNLILRRIFSAMTPYRSKHRFVKGTHILAKVLHQFTLQNKMSALKSLDINAKV